MKSKPYSVNPNKNLQIYRKALKKWGTSTCFYTIHSFKRNKWSKYIFSIGRYDYYSYGINTYYRIRRRLKE